MVVGLGSYRDRNEAYPLDKKTLNAVAWRSFLSGAAYNAETGESVGWLHAMMPGLKKIHTDEEDLALSMGHNLEYVSTGKYFNTLAMGIVLSLEQQKADLETIRSVRTAAGAMCDALGTSLFRYLLIPFTAAWTLAMASEGNLLGVAAYFAVLAVIAVVLRFALIRYGYAKGTRAVESMIRHKDALKHAAKLAGAFAIGGMIVFYGSSLYSGLTVLADQGTSVSLDNALNGIMPGLIPLSVTYLVYHLMTKKNKSLGFCVVLVTALCLILALLGVFGGAYASPLALPWIG